MASGSPASSAPADGGIPSSVDGGLDKTKDFLGGLASDKYGGELLPTVISMRELIESFDKKSDTVLNEAGKCWAISASHQQAASLQHPPPDDSVSPRNNQEQGMLRRARQIRDRRPLRRPPP